MDTVYKYIEYIFFAIIFISALYVLINYTDSYEDMLSVHKEQSRQTVVSERIYEIEDDIISSSELKASLFYDLEYDVQIDDILISKHEHTVEYIETYQIKNINYKRSYAYDTFGNITRVIYIGEGII